MSLECSSENICEIKSPEKIEFSLNSDEELKKIEDWLCPLMGDESAEQCVFVLRSMTGDDYRNHCKDATQEFGRRLLERFGNEESFFDLTPSAKYSDVRSHSPLTQIGYSGDYHSVGMLEIKKGENDSSFLIFDLTYGVISGRKNQDDILVMNFEGKKDEAIKALNDHYGGSWNVEFTLAPENSKFVFSDN